jgi:hypothetical protein
MSVHGICIGGPWHGKCIEHYSYHFEVVVFRYSNVSTKSFWYTYVINEFGEWWVVE